MTLKTQITADQSVFFDTDSVAETVTYNDTPISADFTYGADPQRDAGSQKAKGVLVVKKTDVAAPAYPDTVVIGSTTWYVLNIAKGDDDSWVLNIYTDERHKPR